MFGKCRFGSANRKRSAGTSRLMVGAIRTNYHARLLSTSLKQDAVTCYYHDKGENSVKMD